MLAQNELKATSEAKMIAAVVMGGAALLVVGQLAGPLVQQVGAILLGCAATYAVHQLINLKIEDDEEILQALHGLNEQENLACRESLERLHADFDAGGWHNY